ncbi:MAG TPA: hypothetical protein VGE97_08400 [Nitrososphaera sp.]|jgi:hypothetical protein
MCYGDRLAYAASLGLDSRDREAYANGVPLDALIDEEQDIEDQRLVDDLDNDNEN